MVHTGRPRRRGDRPGRDAIDAVQIVLAGVAWLVCHPGGMNDGVDALEELSAESLALQVRKTHLAQSSEGTGAGRSRCSDDLVTGLGEMIDNRRSHEAVGAGNQDLHGMPGRFRPQANPPTPASLLLWRSLAGPIRDQCAPPRHGAATGWRECCAVPPEPGAGTGRSGSCRRRRQGCATARPR